MTNLFQKLNISEEQFREFSKKKNGKEWLLRFLATDLSNEEIEYLLAIFRQERENDEVV